MDKVAVFADVQNVYYTVKERYNSHFDYEAFMREVTSGRKLVAAVAYAIDRGDPRQVRFQDVLRQLGFEVKLKPFIQRADGSAKGDWDVGIALDMVDYAGVADVLVLASGDGDYADVVRKLLAEHDIAVDVYGVPDLTAGSLVQAASSFSRYFPDGIQCFHKHTILRQSRL